MIKHEGAQQAAYAAALTRDALSTVAQIRSLRSVGLAELDEEITDFLRHAHDNEDITR